MSFSEIKYWKKAISDALENCIEHNSLDFKQSLSEKNDRLKEHINAFGNYEHGGCFVFSVAKFSILDLPSNQEEIIQKITHLAKDTQDPPLNVKVFLLDVEEKKLLCICINSSSTKPVFIKDRAPFGGSSCIKRSGSSTIPMTNDEIRMLLAKSTDISYDETSVDEASLEDLDLSSLKSFIPNLDFNNLNADTNLMTLLDNRILCGSKTNYQITVAGWIIFAINPQSNSIFANAYIEFQMFRGITREEPIKKQAFKGNLPQQIKQSINMLLQNIWVIPKIEGIQRKDIPLYSTEILREVITNAVVHRDYKKMHQPVKIALFSDRIEIENPGGLMPGLTTLNLVHRRDWRNPLVAELMSKFGFGEMDGQGIDRLYVATLALKIPTPVFIDNKISFKVILSSPKKYELFEPNERRNTVLALLINNNTIDNEVVRDTFNITSHQAGTLLKALVREKIIQPVTISRKFAKYSLTDNYREKIFA